MPAGPAQPPGPTRGSQPAPPEAGHPEQQPWPNERANPGNLQRKCAPCTYGLPSGKWDNALAITSRQCALCAYGFLTRHMYTNDQIRRMLKIVFDKIVWHGNATQHVHTIDQITWQTV
jgi:hypothetical protein